APAKSGYQSSVRSRNRSRDARTFSGATRRHPAAIGRRSERSRRHQKNAGYDATSRSPEKISKENTVRWHFLLPVIQPRQHPVSFSSNAQSNTSPIATTVNSATSVDEQIPRREIVRLTLLAGVLARVSREIRLRSSKVTLP